MICTIENEELKVTVNTRGAELTSVRSKQYDLDYLWNGNPEYWAKHSPALFPVVGTLKENTYYFENRKYELPRHGFAREKEFVLKESSSESLLFLLGSDEDTLQAYPFLFELYFRYTISKNTLTVDYEVINKGETLMYFSLGAHPAFNVPLVPGTGYTDYQLVFDKRETLGIWPISSEGLIQSPPVPFLNDEAVIPLDKKLFQNDALVFKYPQSTILTLRSDKTERGLSFDFSGFPYLGIWAAKNADFVCIEPWCGIADSVDSDQQLVNKEGILKIEKGAVFNKQWKLSLF